MKKNTGYKVGIVGTGFVGSTTAYTLLLSGMVSELALVDLNLEKAQGEAMDLRHGIPLCPPAEILVGDYECLSGSDIVILTAGVNQREGETRLHLLKRNEEVFASIVPKVVANAPDAILLVVTNPVDILTHVTQRLSGFAPERVIGSGTVLDTSRLRYLLSQVVDVDAGNIHSYVLGEHGDTEFVAWSLTSIAGMELDEFCANNGCALGEGKQEALEKEVRGAAYEIIRRKGSTYYAVAVAVQRIVRAILRDEQSILTVSSNVRGLYGGLADVCLSLPCVVGGSGIVRVMNVPLCAEEHAKLVYSADTLRTALDSLER